MYVLEISYMFCRSQPSPDMQEGILIPATHHSVDHGGNRNHRK